MAKKWNLRRKEESVEERALKASFPLLFSQQVFVLWCTDSEQNRNSDRSDWLKKSKRFFFEFAPPNPYIYSPCNVRYGEGNNFSCKGPSCALSFLTQANWSMNRSESYSLKINATSNFSKPGEKAKQVDWTKNIEELLLHRANYSLFPSIIIVLHSNKDATQSDMERQTTSDKLF